MMMMMMMMNNKSCGLESDGVNAEHLKHCSDRIVPMLAMCFTGLNHLMYADDLVLLSPSAAGLSILLSICSTYGIEYDVM